MIKAVFFDWSNTLARYAPSREELQSQALAELGFSFSPRQIAPGLAIADRFLFEETAASPVRLRHKEEQEKVYARYQQIVLSEIGAGMADDPQAIMKRLVRLDELYRQQLGFVLYDDVLPALGSLKERKLILGLVTNMDADMKRVCRGLGLTDYLSVIITSAEVGASKPKPKIFLAALEQAGVKASEAIHVGDQLDIDVAGAIAAGIRPILLDRDDSFRGFLAYPRIRSLSEVSLYSD
ncbi:MAG TPA: HAD-IA family hydrolase [Dehalococcoidales bacterium]|nr:HAD-IA family hydrolase [Dehalococcoidales bacterium]